jgi:hypothetical protein
MISAVVKAPSSLLFLDHRNTDLADSTKMITRKSMMLPSDYSPGTWDVICQRGKGCNDHSKFSMTTLASKRLAIYKHLA